MRAQPRDHLVGQRPAVGIQVLVLLRIALEVVELRPRGVNHLVAPGAPRAQVAPPEVVQRVQRLGIALEIERRPDTGHQRHEARPRDPAGRRHVHQVEHGRHQVHRPDRIGHAASAHPIERRADDERHTRGGLVDEEAVAALAVLIEGFAVIADDRNHRLVEQPVAFQEIDDARDLRVHERDFRVVGMVRVARFERFRGVVRLVRIVEVQPAEEPLVLDLLEPRQRLVHDLVARPLNVAQAEPALGLRQVEVVDIGLEALVETPLAVEHVGGDDRARLEALALENRRERQLLRRQEEPAVVAHAVLGRKLAGEDAAVRRERQRRYRHRVLEQHALAREPVDRRCLDVPVAVRADAVGTRGVEGDDEQVQIVPPSRRPAEIQAAGAAGGARREKPPRRACGHDDRRRQQEPDQAAATPRAPVAAHLGRRRRFRTGRRRGAPFLATGHIPILVPGP